MLHFLKRASWCRPAAIVFLLAAALGAHAQAFTTTDLEKMVKELSAFAPKNPKYQYPVQCQIEENPGVNAYATAIEVKGAKNAKPQSKMVVFTGLIELVKGDKRILRAVVAHELSHLVCGHIYSAAPIAQDLGQFWNRSQEAEADKTGAMLLQRAGYSKKDMVDMLMKLEEIRGRTGDWFERLTGTHPDPKARAAKLVDNPSVLRSLLSFDTGLALFDRRDFAMAAEAFEKAYTQEPKLKEAMVNAAQSKLLGYYDGLGGDLRRTWFRPDFGAILKEAGIGRSKGDQISDEDRARYREAVQAIGRASAALPGHRRVGELDAIAKVLDPSGNPATLRAGVDWLASTMSKLTDPSLKLRFAANAAVGLDRLGETQRAYETMMTAQKGTRAYNAALAENVGRLQVTGRSRDVDLLAADVMLTWLANTPSESPNWPAVNENYRSVCKVLSLQPKAVDGAPLYLTAGMSIHLGGLSLPLLASVDDAVAKLGQPDAVVGFDTKYPDLTEMRWKGGDVSVYTTDGQLMRITSSVPGSYVELKPVDGTLSETQKIVVGASIDQLTRILDPDRGVPRPLSNMGKPEEWIYFPPLSLGIRIESGKVAAVTITPIRELN